MKHIISSDDFYPGMIDEIVDRAGNIKRIRRDLTLLDPRLWSGLSQILQNRLMITDFFEPSTRTRLSFEAAMSYLGGHAIGTENAAEFSSFKKGESLEDNFRVISGYCDVIVGRFLNEGDARRASLACEVPLINGGDGTGEHPTQAMIDLFSVMEHFDLYQEELNVVFLGDNKRSRTVQSIARLLANYPAIKKITFVSPNWLQPEQSLIDAINKMTDDPICEVQGYLGGVIVPDVWETANIVYVTRSQDERSDVGVGRDGLVFLPEYLQKMPEKSLILHPLPRNSELPTSIDSDPRAYYFEQAKNGLYVRMAMLEWLFSGTWMFNGATGR